MRILVLSDTHGDFNRMMKAVTEQPTAELLFTAATAKNRLNI